MQSNESSDDNKRVHGRNTMKTVIQDNKVSTTRHDVRLEGESSENTTESLCCRNNNVCEKRE